MSQLWQPTSPTAENAPPSPPRLASEKDSTRQRNPGRRVAQIVKLKPEHVAEYKKCHAAVWPDVLKQIKECNIVDSRLLVRSRIANICGSDSIFWDDASGILFANFKYVGYDYAGDMEKMAENPKVREWWKMTDEMQESLVPDAKSSESGEPSWWKGLEEVFYNP
ncbi:putative L-rhamnose mutarotase [Seiridium unicorne]|uniref:L-rhamnose mutarotase n=1 Tax=Seiridium unicorne TaxID=138068 RepID=A0ABR2UT11_9PEZI